MYVVPRYTEISHFRAPYKDSLLGLGALFSTSASATSAAAPAPTRSPYTMSSGIAASAAPAAASAVCAFDPFGNIAMSMKPSLFDEAVTLYKAQQGYKPWQVVTPLNSNPDLAIPYEMAIVLDPLSNWRKQLRSYTKSALSCSKARAAAFLSVVASSITGPWFPRTDIDALTGGQDRLMQADWSIRTDELQKAIDENMQGAFAPAVQAVQRAAAMASGGGRSATPSGDTTGGQASPVPPPPAPPIIDDQGPPGPGPGTATAGLAGALPWVAAAGVAGAVIWYAVKKKS